MSVVAVAKQINRHKINFSPKIENIWDNSIPVEKSAYIQETEPLFFNAENCFIFSLSFSASFDITIL